MFIFTKILSALLLPPGIIVAALLVIIYRMFRNKERSRYLIVALTMGIYLLSIPAVTEFLLRPLENKYQPKLSTADAIVVLGGGALLRNDGLNSDGSLGEYSAARILTAAQIYEREKIPVVITGGAPMPDTGNEARIGRNVLSNLKLAENFIVVEDQARNTHENAVKTMQLCYKYNWKKIYLVTSAFHMPRAIAEFKLAQTGQEKIILQPYPCDYQTDESSALNLFSFIPQHQSFDSSVMALHEYLGLGAVYLKSLKTSL